MRYWCKATFQMSFDGLVTGGIECSYQKEDNSHEKETVIDLPEWIKKQFLELRKIADRSLQRDEENFHVYRMIWIGDALYPFCILRATPSNYSASFCHAECRFERMPESATLEDICLDVAIKASKVSDLNLKW